MTLKKISYFSSKTKEIISRITGSNRKKRLKYDIQALQERNKKLLLRVERQKEQIATLKTRVRTARVDERGIDPVMYNRPTSMDTFFKAELERSDSQRPYREFAESLYRTLQRHGVDLADRHIFDAGLGNGEMLNSLTNGISTAGIEGMDFSAAGVERARRLMPSGTFRVGDLMNPIAGTFEVVLCTEVLEHIPDAATALQHVVGAIAPRGIGILTVPDGRIDFSNLHINFWSPESWKFFISNNSDGCQVVFDSFRVRPTAIYENNLAIIRR